MIPGKSKNILRQLKIGNILSEDNMNIIKKKHTFTTQLILTTDYERKLFDEDVSRQVSNYIFKYLEDNAKLIKSSISDISLMETGNQNLMTNGNIGSIMQEHKEYKFLGHEKEHNVFYRLGGWKDSIFYINSFLRWDENKILCFDNCDFYNYKATYNNKIIPAPNFNPRFEVSIDIYIDEKILNNLKLYDFGDIDNLDDDIKLTF